MYSVWILGKKTEKNTNVEAEKESHPPKNLTNQAQHTITNKRVIDTTLQHKKFYMEITS